MEIQSGPVKEAASSAAEAAEKDKHKQPGQLKSEKDT